MSLLAEGGGKTGGDASGLGTFVNRGFYESISRRLRRKFSIAFGLVGSGGFDFGLVACFCFVCS